MNWSRLGWSILTAIGLLVIIAMTCLTIGGSCWFVYTHPKTGMISVAVICFILIVIAIYKDEADYEKRRH